MTAIEMHSDLIIRSGDWLKRRWPYGFVFVLGWVACLWIHNVGAMPWLYTRSAELTVIQKTVLAKQPGKTAPPQNRTQRPEEVRR